MAESKKLPASKEGYAPVTRNEPQVREMRPTGKLIGSDMQEIFKKSAGLSTQASNQSRREINTPVR